MSNNVKVLQGLPSESLAASPKFFMDSDIGIAILGLSWHSLEDFFFDDVSKLTKRIVLSRTAKLFDLLGWLAPFVIRAKILMQSLWQEKKGWDEEIDLDHQIIRRNWERELPPIKQLKLLRWNGYYPQAKFVELHGFADASKLAYGASLYLRVVEEDHVTVTLINAKSKVAPLKLLSIPLLELTAAHLLGKLAKHYLRITKIGISSSHL